MKDDFLKAMQDYNESSAEDMTQKQKDIISAALELFSQKGYTATTTASIAAKANVAEKTLFKYYPTKRDLFISVFYRAAADLSGNRFLDALQDDGDIRDRFYKLFTMKFEQTKEEENALMFKLFIQEMLINDDLRSGIIEFILPFWQRNAESSMEKILAELPNKNLDITALNTAVLSLMLGYILVRTTVFPDDKWNDEKNINNLVDILCYGILGKKEDRSV